MQCKAALWILGIFCTSLTGGIEALADLIPIYLHLKKLVKQSYLRAATLPSQYALISLVSAHNSKGIHPHSQLLALLTDAQSTQLRSPLLDTEVLLLNLTEHFDLLHSEAYLRCRLLDNFSDWVSFYSCDHSKGSTIKAHFQVLDCLRHEAFTDPFMLVITDTNVITPRNMQAMSATHFWRLGQQVLSSKVSAGHSTALNTELFAIRLSVIKTTSFNIKHIILITNSLSVARRATLRLLPVNIYPLLQMLFTLRMPLHIWTPRELPSTISYIRVAISFLSKVVIISPSSLPIPKVAAGFLLLASQSHCMPGQLEPFLTTLPLGSSDSAFSLQSALSVCMAIAR